MSYDSTRNQSLNGFLNLNKPHGISSMDAVRQLKRVLPKGHKIGHAGTLDPLAQGVLPICLGQATRLMQYAVEGTKIYHADIQLGYVSDTYDSEGPIRQQHLEQSKINIDTINDILPQFTGMIQQTPPMYSALKIKGQRLYKLARAGVEVPREPRNVQIETIHVENLRDSLLTIVVKCGHGVYIRSLAHDLGQTLGCGGYITNLVRQYSGGFSLSESLDLNVIADASTDFISHHIHPIDWPLRLLPRYDFSESETLHLRQGQSIPAKSISDDTSELRGYNEAGQFFGIIQTNPDQNVWSPSKIFHDLDSNKT
ncbi:MAG: tRNA pseudouridine(55) synthase TruB [Chloroflexota bacterium]|nr:tRNA pseudouridine(55) synthase TruB [Chloroflexota bacterium]